MISFHCRLQTADCFFTDWTLTGLTLRSCCRWWWRFDGAEADNSDNWCDSMWCVNWCVFIIFILRLACHWRHCANCGAIKWFTYRSLHSLMNLMQLWHSWQLTLANGIMDNHGIDSTWQWIDSWKLEVGNWKQMPSWHHDIILHCVDLPQWYWLGTRDWDSGFGISSYS
jgi:hypothetical protein